MLWGGEGKRLHQLLTRLTLSRHAAEDLLQDLFVKLREADEFRKAADPVAYAWRAAIRLAYNWRRTRRRQRIVSDQTQQAPANEPLPLDRLICDEDAQRLLDAVFRLPERMRQAVLLRYIQQESYSTVGRHIGRNAHQTRALCHRAIRRLRRMMTDRWP
jgi:RNA polymerase sigma factor (sigma-70 family)